MTHHTPKHSTQRAKLALVGIASLMIADPALAIIPETYWWLELPNSWGIDVAVMLAVLRAALVGLATLAGFACGWFLSPNGKSLRRTIFMTIAALTGLLALFGYGPMVELLVYLFAFCGFCWGIGYWLGRGIKSLMQPPITFGSSRWATVEHLEEKDLLDQDGIILGSCYDGEKTRTITYAGDRHLLTSAPTRGGKGVSHIIPNLLSYTGSVLVIDPKAENLLVTANARMEMGQEVLAIDPWNIGASKAGLAPARINPLDWLKLSDIDAPENAMLLADALIQKNQKADAFWQEESKALLQGLILLVAFDDHYAERRDLGTVRDLLLLTGGEQVELFTYMAGSVHALIASTGARFLQKDPKLISNVLASAQAETHFLDSTRVREALSASDFDFADLKRTPMSVFVILPADRLEAFNRFLRLIVQQAITVNARNIEDKPAKPVLFILDEMPALGRLTMVEQAYGLMAGFGIQLWGITQDLCQLRRVYGTDYESFIANSGAVAYFGSPDKTSAEYFSGLCGETTVWNLSSAISNSVSWATKGGSSTSDGTSNTTSGVQRKLAYPDELRRMSKDLQLLLIEDSNPIMARKIRWYEDPAFKDKGTNTHKPQ
ncbi:type IV secretory system conjugative DNA transfer family protein [Leisingera sp. S232]|uniref:type IV secretory system conjugative DNA transfer family protein n=1 Tax=Leisingera sp. S232 TaxID=3415132 RepID=UPI003C7E5DD8